MLFDSLAEARQERHFQQWLHIFLKNSPEQLAKKLAERHCSERPTSAAVHKNGAFNICYRVKFEQQQDVIVRFVFFGRTIFRKEKNINEATILRFLKRHTSITVPEILGHGDCMSGPYIVMRFLNGKPLSDLLTTPSSANLRSAYTIMARLTLELSKPRFRYIGALVSNGTHFDVEKRPFSYHINELSTSANLPESAFPSGNFKTATAYFISLANLHLEHLKHQRNNAITDQTDFKKKYIARCLFRKVAGKVSAESDDGPFGLYCDDFRPCNVLVDEKMSISGVIDWEFTYIAPREFAFAAPSWLLGNIDGWEADLEGFLAAYKPRFQLYLEVLRLCELDMIEDGSLDESHRLSYKMERSLDNGLFWVCVAAKSSYLFDEIYWGFLDANFYGHFTSLDDRLQHLSSEERADLEQIYQLKIEQAHMDKLDENYTVDTLTEL